MPVKKILHLDVDQPALVGQFLAEPEAYQGKQVVRVAPLEELINQPGAYSPLPTLRGQEGEPQQTADLGLGVEGTMDTHNVYSLRITEAVVREDSLAVNSQDKTEIICQDAVKNKGSLVAPPGDPGGIGKGT